MLKHGNNEGGHENNEHCYSKQKMDLWDHTSGISPSWRIFTFSIGSSFFSKPGNKHIPEMLFSSSCFFFIDSDHSFALLDLHLHLWVIAITQHDVSTADVSESKLLVVALPAGVHHFDDQAVISEASIDRSRPPDPAVKLTHCLKRRWPPHRFSAVSHKSKRESKNCWLLNNPKLHWAA